MSHYIRTIHTDFTASASASSSPRFSSSWSYAGTSASAHSNLLVGLSGIMNKYPPGLGHSDWRASPASGSTGANPSPYTRRRTGVSIRAPHSSPPARRTPPPPPPSSPTSAAHSYRTQPPSMTYMKFDPFSDDFSVVDPSWPPRRTLQAPMDSVLYRTPRTSPASLVHMAPTVEVAAAAAAAPSLTPAPLDRNARSRLVAGILLNRVHAVGKPMRRRSMDAPKEYVKSGLSRVVSVEA